MKTLWTMAGLRVGVYLTGGYFVWLGLIAGLANGANAAVTPIPVGPAGIVNHFDTLPGLADGWATARRGNSAGAITNGAQMDAAANTNDVSAIVLALATDSTVTNATTMFGSASGGSSTSTVFRWNNGSADHFLESRATEGLAYCVLLAGFVNESGSDRQSAVISYDYGLDLVAGATIDEDPRGASNHDLAGYRVYYSLSGTPGSWNHISEFDGTNGGRRTATVKFVSNWVVGGNLYLLWCDDDAVNGSSGAVGPVEGPNALDNFALDFGVCVSPCIDTQPHSVTVNNCESTNLFVEVTASAAVLQWYKDGNPISGATNAVYPIVTATGAENGNYFVRATACNTTVQSSTATVAVTDTGPEILSALMLRDGKSVVLSFSHRMDASSVEEVDSYAMRPLNGGTEQTISSAVLSSNGTALGLTLAGPVTAQKSYELVIGSGVLDCTGNPITPLSQDGNVHVTLEYEVLLLSMTNTEWRINTNGIDLGTAWRSDSAYDDSAWPTGLSVFDAKSGLGAGRTNVGGYAVMTMLPLTSSNWVNNGCTLPGGECDIPAYYFRTHFTVPADCPHVLSLNLFTLSDDFDVCWINNRDVPAHRRPGFPAGTNVDQFYYSGGTAVADAAVEGPFAIDPTLLRYGDNLICVKQFQVNATSSDITFGYELVAVVSEFGPRISISFDGADARITWPDGTMHLYEATAPNAPAADWTLVPGQSAGSATITGISGRSDGMARFYSLRE